MSVFLAQFLQVDSIAAGLIAVIIAIAFVFVLIVFLINRYKRCPSDRILVKYGKVGGDKSAQCIHGGGTFVWPVIQDYSYLDLTPISIEVNLTNALSKQNIRVNVPSRFTIGISTEPDIMQNAAERLLGLGLHEIQELAQEIIFGQLRLVVASMDIEEINSDRDKFLNNISNNLELELKKVGLKLINVNITDIRDESGYIEALGKEAAAKAINEAKIRVAEQERTGDVGKTKEEKERDIRVAEMLRDRDVEVAVANKDKEIRIAETFRDESIGKADAERDTRIKIAEANATAVEGENISKVKVADSDALRREAEAEALKKATAAEKVQEAKALQEAYMAQKEAELARAEKEKAEQEASIVVSAQIQKEKAIIEAQAVAEQTREEAKGQADALFAKYDAEAKGMYEILTKQAEGLDQIVKAAGNNAQDAFLLLLADKLPELAKIQAEAIKNIKIDKVTVWDNGAKENGKTSTANFLSGMYQSIPPLQDMFNMAGMKLPDYLGKEEAEQSQTKVLPSDQDPKKSVAKSDKPSE